MKFILASASPRRRELLASIGLNFEVMPSHGVKYIFSRRFAEFLGGTATYTRQRGLERATNKELLVRHILLHGETGSTLCDLADVLPQLTIDQARTLLKELKRDQRVHPVGTTRAARWFPESGTKT